MGLEPLILSVCVCIFVCVSGVEDKWPNSLITSAAPVGVPTAGEQRGTERRNRALVSPSFLLALPPFLPSCMCPSHTLPTGPAPLSSSQIHTQALISMEEEVDRRGPLATLTQLVGLIKRVCGLWVRAQTHQETGRPMPPLRYRNTLGSNNKISFTELVYTRIQKF